MGKTSYTAVAAIVGAFALTSVAHGAIVDASTSGIIGRPSPDTTDLDFWTSVGDTTLVKLLGVARIHNRDVYAAAARVEAARAQRRLVALDFVPTVTSAAGFTRQRYSASQLPGTPYDQRLLNTWDVGLNASWEVDVFGRLRKTYGARSALEASAREDVRAVQLSLAAEVAQTYFELRGAQRELQVAQRNAENQRHTLQLTNDRLDAGRGTALDRERATAQLNGTLSLIPGVETRVAAAINRLNVLLGGMSPELSASLTTYAALPAVPARPAIDTVSAFIRARPDVRSAERQYAAQRSLVGAAQAEYLPHVNLVAGAGYNGPKADSLGAASSRRYVIGPVISWPLLDLGRVKTQVDLSRASAREARARYDQVVLSAAEEAQNALVTFDRAQQRLGYLRAAEEASERGADLARMRFTNGASDFLEVLDAERTLLEQQDQLARGETDAVTAFVLLYKALGGQWPTSAAHG